MWCYMYVFLFSFLQVILETDTLEQVYDAKLMEKKKIRKRRRWPVSGHQLDIPVIWLEPPPCSPTLLCTTPPPPPPTHTHTYTHMHKHLNASKHGCMFQTMWIWMHFDYYQVSYQQWGTKTCSIVVPSPYKFECGGFCPPPPPQESKNVCFHRSYPDILSRYLSSIHS